MYYQLSKVSLSGSAIKICY